MKNNKIIISLIMITTVISLTLIYYLSYSNPLTKHSLDNEYIDNRYNNAYLSEGNLARIGNKVYFNYNPDGAILKYGLYELSKNGSKRIFWDGPSIKSFGRLSKMQVYNNYLLASNHVAKNTSQPTTNNELISQFFGSFYNYNLQTNKIENLFTLEDAEITDYKYYYVLGNNIYIFTDNKIYLFEEGMKSKEIFNNLSTVVNKTAYEKLCYIYEDKLLYVTTDGNLVEYDFILQKEIYRNKLNLNIESIRDVFVCSNKIIATVYTDDSIFEVYVIDSNKELLYQKELQPYYYINAYNDMIFVSSISGGLDIINVNTHNVDNIINSNVCDTYIIDSNQIYYFNKKDQLICINYLTNKT